MESEKRILIVEDDKDLGELVAHCCAGIGWQGELVGDGETGLARALSNEHQLIILDVGLPRLSGFEVCQRLRELRPGVAILMLTSRRETAERVFGLEIGADDYVTKPFDSQELGARIKALLRRCQPDATRSGEPVVVGPLRIDPVQRKASVFEKEVELTVLEFDALLLLASRPGQVFSREQLMEEVWGYHSSQFDGSVTKLFSRLRLKLQKESQNLPILETIRGIGYRCVPAKE